MYVSVFFFFYKELVLLKIISARMFKNKISVRQNKPFLKYFVGNGIQSFNIIRRICKNNVKFFGTDLKEIKDVVSYNLHTFYLVCWCHLFDELGMHGVHLYAYNIFAAA